MPTALILSSHVASSQVGGTVQALALARLGIDPVLVPTVLYGRHPGLGAPGGAAVPIETFEGMLEGIAANGVLGRVDLVITGYFASADQVRAAARAIDAVCASSRDPDAHRPLIVVDPIMGDTGKGLYVGAEAAGAIADELIGRAHVVRPNAWELERLTGVPVGDPASAVSAARALGKATLVSSVARGDGIGVVYADAEEAWLAVHSRTPRAPNGTGDLLTVLFSAHLLMGVPAGDALGRAVGSVAAAVADAQAGNLAQLPVLEADLATAASAALRPERLA